MKRIVRIMSTLVIVAFFAGSTGFMTYAAEGNTNAEQQAVQAAKAVPSKLSVFKRNGNESYYFDAARYASDYPDLYAAFGDNRSALWNHYKTNGVVEGRTVYGTTDEVNAKLRAFDVAASITNNSMSDREKIRAVHDWIVNNTVYDYQNYLQDSIPDVSYEMEGVMLRGTAVCSGYAKAFDYFMYVLGIEDEYLDGVAWSDGTWGGHAWNRVWVDGDWAYIDCTWDDPVGSEGNFLEHDYFLVSYEEISRDHTLESTYLLY